MKLDQNNIQSESNSKNNANFKNIRKNIENIKEKTIRENEPFFTRKHILIIVISIIIILGVIVSLAFLIKHFYSERINKNENKNQIKALNPLELEFKINFQIFDLKRFLIIQKYNEDMKINGKIIKLSKYRKAYYDLFIISEEDSNEQFKIFYNKTYKASISLVSECSTTENNDCIPQKLVDLSDQNYSKIINLEENDDLKDFPIPICLVNFTDNGVILTMNCPESLSINKLNTIFLDMNYIKPISIKRYNREERNITITKEIKEGKQFIRETNGGSCDIENSYLSFCTKDMNSTLDSIGNLLSFNEIDIINIINNEDNSYIRNKKTKLEEIIYNSQNLSSENYKKNLDKLLEKIFPYMKKQNYATLDNFQKLYNDTKNIINSKELKRKLEEEKTIIYSEENIFSYPHNLGFNLNIFLGNNIGYNAQAMEGILGLNINGNKYNIINVTEITSLNIIIKKLVNLSKAGNILANRLYNKIIGKLQNLEEIISNNITNLNNLIIYKDLVEIFNSTLSSKKLEFNIIEESSDLVNKFDKLLNGIENDSLKNKTNILNYNIYDYLNNSHHLIDKIINDLKEFGEALSSPKSKLTEIAIYYLNNTPSSYIELINEVKNIIDYFYKNETDLIVTEVDSLITNFENNITNLIDKDIKFINNLIEQLKNKNVSIENATDNDLETIIANLDNSKHYISKIILEIKKSIKKEMNLKDSGYLISNEEIKSKNESSNEIIQNSYDIGYKFDNDELIDKTFDKIMTYASQNYTSIIKYMNDIRLNEFSLEENLFGDYYFTVYDQYELENNIYSLGISILNKIRKENNYYIKEAKQIINSFIEENREYLDKLITELDILFSKDNLEKLANQYDIFFKNCLNKIKNDIQYNKLLIDDYFNKLSGVIQNNTKIVELLKTFKTDEEFMPYLLKINGLNCTFKNFEDKINSKVKTEGYLNKYNLFLENLAYSKEYLNNELNTDLLYEYKNMIIKMRDIFSQIKNNIFDDKYQDCEELNFINKNIKIFDEIDNRFNKYISDNIFKNKYLEEIKNLIELENSEINQIGNSINNYHEIINTEETNNDYYNDFCINFDRKKSYIEGNGNIYYISSTDYYCFPVSTSSNNYNKLSKISIFSDDNINKFRKNFNEFYLLIKNNINSYNDKINYLKNALLSIEEDTINKKYTLDYMIPIKNEINNTLLEKYENELIKDCYNYFQYETEIKVEKLLKDISNKWYNYLDLLIIDINKNLNNFKYSFKEIEIINSLYEKTISENITKSYIDSIVIHQKNEFNYTISFYYNVLLKIIISTQQYIISNIPNNRYGFNNIIKQRKEEVEDMFNKLINQIIISKNNSLLFQNQINILEVDQINFFKIDSILSNNIVETQKNINNKILQININNSNLKENDLYSLSSKLYLGNSLSENQIYKLINPINNKEFIYLNLQKFKEIINENLIFDQDGFINELNLALYNSNLEITNHFSMIKEGYKELLEKKISTYYTKDSIIETINNFYENQIKNIDNNKQKQINGNIDEIIYYIKNKLLVEVKRLKTTVTFYNNNFTKINNTLNELKSNIFNKLNSAILNITDNFYQNILNNYYITYIEIGLNNFLEKVKDYLKDEKSYDLLNLSYNITNIIGNIIDNLIKDYKNIAKINIDNKNIENYEKIKKEVKLDEIQKIINDEIDKLHIFNLLPTLQNCAAFSPIDKEYEYDLSVSMKKDIELYIDSKLMNISSILEEIKGNNYQVQLLENQTIDFDKDIKSSLHYILDDFNNFINSEKINEEKKINNDLKRIIKLNFNNLLDTIISSFGNEYFERIIKYNENFQIPSLYNNIKYSVAQTLSYYIMLYIKNNNINSLPKDLKSKLYSINNLDINNKNNQLFNLVNEEIEQFIKESKEYIINLYIDYLKSDVSIEINFNNNIKIEIIKSLNEIKPEIENDCNEILIKYLKNNFVISYNDTMNKYTNNLNETIEEKMEMLNQQINNLITLDLDGIHIEINNKQNILKESIQEYKQYFNKFKISENVVQYLNDFGQNEIKPFFKIFCGKFNNTTNNNILSKIENNCKIYENAFRQNEFVNTINSLFSYIKNVCIEDIKENLKLYGPSDYSNNLQNETNIVDRHENENGNKENKNIDIIFNKLTNFCTKIDLNRFGGFDSLEKVILNNTNYQNYAFIETQKIIDNNIYEEEMNNILTNKLTYLKNISSEYYKNVNQSFYQLINYLNNSIYEIDNLLNENANITYYTLNNEFEKIIKETENIEKEYNEDGETKISNINISELYNLDATIQNFNQKVKFKFNIEYEDTDNKLKIIKLNADVINRCKIEITFEIFSLFGECRKKVERIRVNIKKANFTTSIHYNTSSPNINVTNIFELDKYEYKISKFKIKDENCETTFDEEVPKYCYKIKRNNSFII